MKYAYQELPHSEDTAFPHSQEKEKEGIFNNHFQNRHHKQLTKLRTRGVTALERSVAKQFATGGLNQVRGCTNLSLAPTGSHINKQLQVVSVK